MISQNEINFDKSIERALKTALLDYPKAEETILRLKSLLLIKGKEYRRNNDPYHNFNEGAKLMNVRPMMVLNFFRLKHVISIADLQKDYVDGVFVRMAQINEKFDDILVYTLIELAYTEKEQEASFQVYENFIRHLADKMHFVNKLGGGK